MLTNYAVILSVLEEIMDEYRGNAEATASGRGVHAVMGNFSFLFGVMLAEKVFCLTDRLSRALQSDLLIYLALLKNQDRCIYFVVRNQMT